MVGTDPNRAAQLIVTVPSVPIFPRRGAPQPDGLLDSDGILIAKVALGRFWGWAANWGRVIFTMMFLELEIRADHRLSCMHEAAVEAVGGGDIGRLVKIAAVLET